MFSANFRFNAGNVLATLVGMATLASYFLGGPVPLTVVFGVVSFGATVMAFRAMAELEAAERFARARTAERYNYGHSYNSHMVTHVRQSRR